MPQIQIGTQNLPLIVEPRINKTPRTVTWIKDNQSYLYINDDVTPMVFGLEYMKRGDTEPELVMWDEDKSTDNTLYFPVPDTFYAEPVKWSLMIFWQVTKEDPPNPDIIEKIYIENAIALEVKDINNIK